MLKSNIIIKLSYKSFSISEIQLKELILSNYGFDRADIIKYIKLPNKLISKNIYGNEFNFINILDINRAHIPIEIIDTTDFIFKYENGIVKLKRFTNYDYNYLNII